MVTTEGKGRGWSDRMEEDRPGQAGEGRGAGGTISHADPDPWRHHRRPRGGVAEGEMFKQLLSLLPSHLPLPSVVVLVLAHRKEGGREKEGERERESRVPYWHGLGEDTQISGR